MAVMAGDHREARQPAFRRLGLNDHRRAVPAEEGGRGEGVPVPSYHALPGRSAQPWKP